MVRSFSRCISDRLEIASASVYAKEICEYLGIEDDLQIFYGKKL